MNILSIAVHPDDETLGCGGTLLRHISAGDSIHWLIITVAHEPLFSPEQIARQEAQVMAVQKAYPFESLHWLKFPTTCLDTLPMNDLVAGIRQIVQKLRPQVVFIPNRSDVHSDHRIVFQASQAVFKSFYMRSLGVERILACEVISETEAAFSMPESTFLPNVYVDISDTLDQKLANMQIYQSELHSEFLPRSVSAIRAMARLRGATIGVEYAEAFMLLREIK
jgi:LmbE family N-acetylglucosaminyl deacetylase